ncbi:MAG TPA: hypothetical protein VFI70_07000 [Nitrososphaeraceae archaeon]|nr:hypothetical protein [Nitrososphaeraceae archaeon]
MVKNPGYVPGYSSLWISRGGSVSRILLLGGGDRQSLTLSVVLINQDMLIFLAISCYSGFVSVQFFHVNLLFGVLFFLPL